MVVSSGRGLRHNTRDCFSKARRKRGVIPETVFQRVYKVGDYVDVVCDPAQQKVRTSVELQSRPGSRRRRPLGRYGRVSEPLVSCCFSPLMRAPVGLRSVHGFGKLWESRFVCARGGVYRAAAEVGRGRTVMRVCVCLMMTDHTRCPVLRPPVRR